MSAGRNALLVATAFALGCGANALVVDPVERGSGETAARGNDATTATSDVALTSERGAAAASAAAKEAAAKAPTTGERSTAAPGAAAGHRFREAAAYETGGSPQGIATADYDGDGAVDVAVGDATRGCVTVLFNSGDGTFAEGAIFDMHGASTVITAGDFDGDGLPDLAGAGPDGVVVRRNIGRREFGAPVMLLAARSPIAIAAGDVDADGRDEIVVASHTADAENIALYFDAIDDPARPPERYASDLDPSFVSVRDLDGDGLPEIVAACAPASQGRVAVLANVRGAFGDPVRYSTGVRPASLAFADFDGDGRTDIVTRAGAGLFGLRAEADRTFAPALYEPMIDGSLSIAAADIDGDGREDLVTETDANLVVFLGRPGQAETRTEEYRLAAAEIALADLNGDGKPDVVAVGAQLFVMLQAP